MGKKRGQPARHKGPPPSYYPGDNVLIISGGDPDFSSKLTGKEGVIRHSISNPGSKKTSAYYKVYIPELDAERSIKGHNLTWIPDPSDTRPRYGGRGTVTWDWSRDNPDAANRERSERTSGLTGMQLEAFSKTYDYESDRKGKCHRPFDD